MGGAVARTEKQEPPAGSAGGAGERRYVTLALQEKEEVAAASHHDQAIAPLGERQLDTRASGELPDIVGRTMIDPSARPGGRRNAPRRRRPPRRPTDHHDRSVTGNGDGGSSSGNLTTINLLPPVEAPTGFAALGVPERIDLGLAAAGFAQPFAIQTKAIPIALQGRDVCGRAAHRVRQDVGVRRPDARPASPMSRPSRAPARSRARARPASWPSRWPKCSTARGRRGGMRVLPVYGGASRHQQIEALARKVSRSSSPRRCA